MTWLLLSGLVVFAIVASITPGPNNMMLMASGAHFGLRRTVPHVLGVILGFGLMVLLVGWGLVGILLTLPVVFQAIRWAGGVYLLFLAFKIATAHGIGGGAPRGQPLTFLQAAGFQWVNPKAWAMALGADATYAPHDHIVLNITLIALVFTLVGAPCVSAWAVFGVGIKRVLHRPLALRAFNLGMALLLVLSLYPLLTERLGRA